jgi:hypothetical protein
VDGRVAPRRAVDPRSGRRRRAGAAAGVPSATRNQCRSHFNRLHRPDEHSHARRPLWLDRPWLQRSLIMLSATSIHGSQHRACGNYSRAYESSLTCEIALADKAPLSARKGMGIDASESSDSVASLGSGRDSK